MNFDRHLPNFWKRLQSIFYPVLIRKGSSALNARLELFYFNGRYILSTGDAVYSDGHQYKPLVEAFSHPVLKPMLAGVSSALVLGTGLASAVHVLDRMGYHPKFTMVDIDALVLEWAAEVLPVKAARQVTMVHADAFHFIESDRATYDLIIVDIFFGREVPEAVTGKAFLVCCKERLNKSGYLVLNFMPRKKESPDAAKVALGAVFGMVAEISFGINRVYIAND